MSVHTIQELKQFQAMPLQVKIAMTKVRIRDWVNYYGREGVYVSFSGGKDSTVLLHLVREEYPDIPAVFVDTGLEYPEIRQFVKTFDNVTWIKPKMTFKQVIEKYGYPFISKEVSECVYGARKYLTQLVADGTILQTDRQTDRQYKYEYRYKKLCGVGEYSKFSASPITDKKQGNGGGKPKYLFEYNKLHGLGKYAKTENGKPRRRAESTTSDNAGGASGEVKQDGDYP